MPGEARPFVYLQQQFGDLDAVGSRRLVDQGLCGSQGTAASSGVTFRPDSVMMASGSSLGQRHAVDLWLRRQRQPVMQVLVAIGATASGICWPA